MAPTDPSDPNWSLTAHLKALDPTAYQTATQSPFLDAAGRGTLQKAPLSRWLANDRLYIHAYLNGTGRMLSVLAGSLPPTEPAATHSTEAALVAWFVDALVNGQREERFFIDTAARYGLDVNLPVSEEAAGRRRQRVAEADKLGGLRAYEALFAGVGPGPDAAPLPWLEGAMVFYATERCYLDAWSWCRARMEAHGGDAAGDADGGALREAFIGNWTSPEFVEFVERLGRIIDAGVDEVRGSGDIGDVLARAEAVWKATVAAEIDFWPGVDGN